MIDKELLEQFQMLVGMIERMPTRDDLKALESRMGNMECRMLTKDDVEPISDRSANKAAALVEQKLGRRLNSLVDGYKLVHEKQWELERQNERLMCLIDDLQSRVAVIENRTA